jgi:hypothetical protein
MITRASALAALLSLIWHARLAVAPGLVIPGPVLLFAAEVLLAAGGAWLAVRVVRGFRSSPSWRTITSREVIA